MALLCQEKFDLMKRAHSWLNSLKSFLNNTIQRIWVYIVPSNNFTHVTEYKSPGAVDVPY